METIRHEVDFCVVGGGLAGLCAAVAAARAGAKTLLMQERPMLGGNASSEIRMWVCGADHCRETGLLEEIQLECLYRNPYKLYPVWDSILYGKAIAEENLTLLLNCSCCDAEMAGTHIRSIRGWQMTTQTWHTVHAHTFADCSGDSVLAPLTGAHFRMGREGADEFGEDISLERADACTMGMSCLIQARRMDEPVTFHAPAWATRLTKDQMQRRPPRLGNSYENFWYLELGGDRDTIRDTETLRDELLALAFGYWDYVKNSGEYDAACWQLEFVGFLPGKRESRRMLGPHILTQTDILAGGRFDDVVAYGGWGLDDHYPGGFYHPGPPNRSPNTPSPYGIPYRSLYSRNIGNLFFAGRNISMTHAAMSSARVMGTCALLGQAVGEAAAMAAAYGEEPDGIYQRHLAELQARIQYHDVYLPGKRRAVSALTRAAALDAPGAQGMENLRDGSDRDDVPGDSGSVCRVPLGGTITYRLATPQPVREVRIVFDSDLRRATLPGDDCERGHSMRANITPESPVMTMPQTLVKSYRLECCMPDGTWETVVEEVENIRRLVLVSVEKPVTAVRLTPLSLWNEEATEARVFAFEMV